MQTEFEKFEGLFKGINILIWIVGIGTLLAGVIGVSNIMLIIIKERTKEIGIRRALGAKPRVIVNQIIVESVFLTTVAGYIGLAIGIGLVELVNKLLPPGGKGSEPAMFANPEVDLKVAFAALIILIFSGMLAGIMPAKRAVSINTVEALKDEL